MERMKNKELIESVGAKPSKAWGCVRRFLKKYYKYACTDFEWQAFLDASQNQTVMFGKVSLQIINDPVYVAEVIAEGWTDPIHHFWIELGDGPISCNIFLGDLDDTGWSDVPEDAFDRLATSQTLITDIELK